MVIPTQNSSPKLTILLAPFPRARSVLVVTLNALELSWLIFQLKDAFGPAIEDVNKYVFYTTLGRAAHEAILSDGALQVVLRKMLKAARTLLGIPEWESNSMRVTA